MEQKIFVDLHSYVDTTKKEILLKAASPLLTTLEQNKDDAFWIGDKQLTNAQIIEEIKNLSALGKEFLLNFFEAQQKLTKYHSTLKNEN